MDEETSVPAYATRIAALGGFLEGISYLNRDHRSDLATAFAVDASTDHQCATSIQSTFSHLRGLTIRLDDSFQGGWDQLEQDIRSRLLVKPFVIDEQTAEDMRVYLACKIMDRLDDVINDLSQMGDDAVLKRYEEPKRFIGTHEDISETMVFYLLRYRQVSFVLYFLSSVKGS